MSTLPHIVPVSRYADVEQAADYLHVSVGSIRRWLTTGKLKGHKAGRRVLIKFEDLDDVLTPRIASKPFLV